MPRAAQPEELTSRQQTLLEAEPDEESTKYLEELRGEERHDRLMRRILAPFVLAVVAGWLIFVAVLLVFEGFHLWGFDLGDAVLSTAVAATALFGLLGIVLRYYFPKE